ncbi:hypothetical protein DFH28DRAFT_1124633 [Melampsora americana]|nr:hypothetical protein DFH28DRAFT_1124633 [Melampsora americana]
MTTYYQLLNLNPSSTSSDIEKAYKKQALLHHPDRNRDGDQALATERFQRISEAYQTLKDPIRRMKYDAKLKHRSTTENTYFSSNHQPHSAPVPPFKPTRSTSTPAYDSSRTSRHSAAPPPTSSKKPTSQPSTNQYSPPPNRSHSRPSSGRPKPTFHASFDLPRTTAHKAQETPHFEWFTEPQDSSYFEFSSNLKPRSKPSPRPDFPPTNPTTTSTTLPSHRTPLSSAYTKTPSVSNRPPRQANTFYANKSRASSKSIPKDTTSSSFFDIFSSSKGSKPTETRSSTFKPNLSKSPDDPDFMTSAFAQLLSKSVPSSNPIKPIIPEYFKDEYPKFHQSTYQDQSSKSSAHREEYKSRPIHSTHSSSAQKNRDHHSQSFQSKPRPRSYSNTQNDSLHQWREEVASNTMRYPKVESSPIEDNYSEGEELYGVNWPPIKSKSSFKESKRPEDQYESLFKKINVNHHSTFFEPNRTHDHHNRESNENLNRRRRTYSASETVSVHFTHPNRSHLHHHHHPTDQTHYGHPEWIRKEVKTFTVQNHW